MADLLPVPYDPDRNAAMMAIASVERSDRKKLTEYSYAREFFWFLRGSKRITIREVRYFSVGLTDKQFRGKKTEWLRAINILIRSRGACCCMPLPDDAGHRLFPEIRFRVEERKNRQCELRYDRYERSWRKRERERKALKESRQAQAEADLAFQTPDSLSAWYDCWSHHVPEWKLTEMIWPWVVRFPSMKRLDKCDWTGSPLWAVVSEIRRQDIIRCRAEREMDCWLVPNKLTCVKTEYKQTETHRES